MPWTASVAKHELHHESLGGAGEPTRRLTYRDAVREALSQALELDDRVFVIGEGVDDPGGVFGTTLGLQAGFGPDRVMDSPIAENGMTGVAIGAALAGLRPVFVHQRVDFLAMAMDQIINHAAKWKCMTGGRVTVPLTVRAIVGRGWGSAAQHSQSLQALFAHIPGLQVLLPASPRDAKGMLLGGIFTDGPTIVIEHRWLYDHSENVPPEPYAIRPGKCLVRRPGKDVTIVAVSHLVVEALKAALELEAQGVSAEVVDLRSARPLDEEGILASVAKTGRLVVADTGWTAFGVSAEVAAVAAEKAFGDLKAPVRRVGLPPLSTPASHVLEAKYYPDAGRIAAAALELV